MFWRPCSRTSAITSSYMYDDINIPYLCSDKPEVNILSAYEAQDQVVDGLRNVVHVIRGDEECLQGVVFEGLNAKFDVLVADIRKDCRLRVHFVVLTRLGNDATLYVTEQATRND